MIDQVTINRILEAARIDDVVGEFVSLRKRGANLVGLCPFHDEKTPSFSVSPSKGICKCFSCGKGGNVVHFIMEHEQLGYYDALKWLANKYHIEVIEKEMSPEELQSCNDRESMFVVNAFAATYFSQNMRDSVAGKSLGLAYFKERGIREDMIKKFQLGYCSDSNDYFSKTAIENGYRKEYLLKTGLSVEGNNGSLLDRYHGRVIFPIHTVSGKVAAFGGRILKKSDKLAKYINSPESEIYHKSAELYGIYFAKQAIVKQDRCYLVEGYLDVISMHQAGIENVVASSGTSLTHGQIRLIHRFTENVTVLYDGDAAGIKASLRGINLLLEEGLNIQVVLLPEGEDPDSYTQKHGASEVTAYIMDHQQDFIRFKTDILLRDTQNDPIKRAGLIEDVLESIAVIPNEIIRSEYIKECSRQLDTREELLTKEVGKKRYRYLEQLRKKTEIEERNRRYLSETVPAAGHSSLHTSVSPPAEEDVPFPGIEDMPQEQSAGSAHPQDKNQEKKSLKTPYEDFERNLLRCIVRYGNEILFTKEGQKGISVLEYIASDLQAEEIQFTHPLYRKMLEEACRHLGEEAFVPEHFFLCHQDAQVSLLAAELSGNRYELSKKYTERTRSEKDRLKEIVPQLLEELKFKMIQEELRQVRRQIKVAQQNHEDQQVLYWIKEFADLQQQERLFAKKLGERIINK